LAQTKRLFPIGDKEKKGATMHRRLILFFSFVVVSVILAFTLLLMIFGITGSGHQTLFRYLESELSHISQAVNDDFGNLSVTGISLAQTLTAQGENFFQENNLDAAALAEHPEYIEQLLSRQTSTLISIAENNACGGVFIILDATVNPHAENAEHRKAGVFLKKTQPVSSASLGAKEYWLRGPASVAREYGVELLGQWIMEYDVSEIPFFDTFLETSRQHADTPLSRLYYWSDCLCLIDNSEEGILLCLPLRSQEGVVYGLCGIEVSDRMFKMLYSPNEGSYSGIFSLAAPYNETALFADRGLPAGNTYLSTGQLKETLSFDETEQGFSLYSSANYSYGGLITPLKLYPTDSPYTNDTWAVAMLMPESALSDAIRGSSAYLYLIIGGLLGLSLLLCNIISRQYLRPIQKGLSSIQAGAYEETSESGLLEIDNLFEFLAQDVRERRAEMERLTQEAQEHQEKMERLAQEAQAHQEQMERLTQDVQEHQREMERLASEKQDMLSEYEKAQRKITHLSTSLKQEIDPEDYQNVIDNLHTLTQTERQIFEYYFAGKSTKEIIVLMNIKESTLKFHNTNIYEKLGVKNRRELMQYAALIDHERQARKKTKKN